MNVHFSRIGSVICVAWALAMTSGCNGLESQGPKTVTAASNAAPTAPTLNSNQLVTATSSIPATVVSTPANGGATTNTATIPVRIVPPKNLAPEIAEVAKLADNGVNDEVMLAFVERSTNTYKLGPEELIYLSDIGVAPAVITAMQRKGSTPPDTAVSTPNIPTPATGQPAATAPPPLPAVAEAPAAGTPPSGVIVAPTTTNVVTPTYVPGSPLAEAPPAPTPPAGQVVVQQPVVVPPPVTVTYFTDALSPYGSWVEVDGYGRCWRPDYAVLGPSWRPYADGGRWIWSDHGWYWMSDYPWGWATFHYGRWHLSGHHGWVWLPDTVWGPSWVCWRQTSSHCGWAPLPPGAYFRNSSWYYHDRHVGFDFGFSIGFSSFTFISWSRFCDTRPHHYYASHSHASKLYRESTVINNTIVGNNNTVVFEGVGRQAVARASRAPIPQASVRETAWTTASGGTRERLNQGQGGSVLESPRLAAAPPSTPTSNPASGRWAPSRNTGSSGNVSSTPALSGLSESSRPAGISREIGSSSIRSGFDPINTGGSVFIPSTRGSTPTASTPSTGSSSVPTPSRSVAPTPVATVQGLPLTPSTGAGGRRAVPVTTAPSSNVGSSGAPAATPPSPVTRGNPVPTTPAPSRPAQPFNPQSQIGGGSVTPTVRSTIPNRAVVPERVAGSGLNVPTTPASSMPNRAPTIPAPAGNFAPRSTVTPSLPSYTPPSAARNFAPSTERSAPAFRSAPVPATSFSPSPGAGRSFTPSTPSPSVPSRSIGAAPSAPAPSRSVAPAAGPARSFAPPPGGSGSGSGSGRRERDR